MDLIQSISINYVSEIPYMYSGINTSEMFVYI